MVELLFVGACLFLVLTFLTLNGIILYRYTIEKNKIEFQKEKFYSEINFYEKDREIDRWIIEQYEYNKIEYIINNSSRFSKYNKKKLIIKIIEDIMKDLTEAKRYNLKLVHNCNTDKEIQLLLIQKTALIISKFEEKYYTDNEL